MSTQDQSWREAALARSEAISDAWEVTKTYAGRLAEWVLFGCMIVNIVEILTKIPTPVSNVVLGIQVVMLDVGGFALATMAANARDQGNEQAARKAATTGRLLIGVTVLTLLLVTLGLLWPEQLGDSVNGAEKVLILVRIVMTVIYGHVIHSLRRSEMHQHRVQTQVDVLEQQVGQALTKIEQNLALQVQQLQGEMQQNSASISLQFRGEIQALSEQLLTLISREESLQNSEEISQESDGDSTEESDEEEEPDAPSEANGTKSQGRRYFLTFQEVSEQTGLSISQLNRQVKAGTIEVNAHGKIRVKSLENLQQNSGKKSDKNSKDSQRGPVLRLVGKS